MSDDTNCDRLLSTQKLEDGTIIEHRCRKDAGHTESCTARYYRTTYTFMVLSEERIPEDMPLNVVVAECDDGDYVGQYLDSVVEVLDAKAMAQALRAAGSTPDFFDLEDDVEDEPNTCDTCGGSGGGPDLALKCPQCNGRGSDPVERKEP